LSPASSSSQWLLCRWRVRAENRLYFGFRGYLLANVQVPVQGGDVFSHFPIVGYRPIAKSVGQLQTLTGLRCCDGGSLQTFIFSIEFVDEHQFLGSLHYFGRSRLARTPSIGGSRAVRKPPFCKIRRFFRNEVFFTDNTLKSFLLRRSFVF